MRRSETILLLCLNLKMQTLNKIVFYLKILFAVIGGLLQSCDSKVGSQDGNSVDFDSAKVIEQSLQYVFGNNSFAPTYYTRSIKIVRSANVPSSLKFIINGRLCELVDQPDKFYTDVFKPIPYVEVEKIKFINREFAEVDLIFPATGHWFMLELSKDEQSDWKVVKMREATI